MRTRRCLSLVAVVIALAACSGAADGESSQTLAFSSARDGNSDLYLIRADGSGLRRLASTPPSEHAPAWSPDSRRIAFVREGGDAEIYVAGASGRNVIQLTRNRFDDVLPAWSPDGRRLAFASNRSGGFEIYVAAADGSRVRRVTRGATRAYGSFYPAWSPDGRLIAFASSARTPENQEIYVVRPDGSGLVRLTRTRGDSETLGDDYAPSWSPDGRQIVFGSNRTGEGEVWIIQSDGSRQRRLLTLPRRDETAPSFSRDGAWIAFASRAPSGRSDVYVARADGTGARRLTRGESPAWRP